MTVEDVECSVCSAVEREQCKTMAGRPSLPHAARVRAARRQARTLMMPLLMTDHRVSTIFTGRKKSAA